MIVAHAFRIDCPAARRAPFACPPEAEARTARLEIREVIKLTNTLAASYGGSTNVPVPAMDLAWGDGAGENSVQEHYAVIGATIANAGTTTIDLRSLTVEDGGSITLVEVRAIFVRCRDYALTFAKGGTNGWTGLGTAWTITPPAGCWFRIVCGTDGAMGTTASVKTIDITNASGSTATYDVVIVGVTA